MFQQTSTDIPHVSAQHIVHTHLTTKLKQDSQGDFFLEFDHKKRMHEAIQKNLQGSAADTLGLGVFMLVITLFVMWGCRDFVPVAMQGMFDITIYVLGALALIGTVVAVVKQQQIRNKVRQEMQQRLAGFDDQPRIFLRNPKLSVGESFMGIFEHKVTDHRKIAKTPSLQVKLCCYEITETAINLSVSEFEKEAVWQFVDTYQVRQQEDLRVPFSIAIPDDVPLSTATENIHSETEYWIGKKFSAKTHILWLLELYEPVTQMDWYVPIEVTSPAS